MVGALLGDFISDTVETILVGFVVGAKETGVTVGELVLMFPTFAYGLRG